jgi:lysozyme
MKTSKAGIDLITRFEGLELKAYPDPGTRGDPWTIGVGHTSVAGLPLVKKGMTITRAEAITILARDLGVFERGVAAVVKVALTDAQFSALVSFAFNVGLGNLRKSGVLKAVNAKRFDDVPQRLAQWNKAAGRVLAGLVKRRAAEGQLFAGPSVVSLFGDAGPSTAEIMEMRHCIAESGVECDAEERMAQTPLLKHRRVWATATGWLGGSGAGILGMLSGWDWMAILVIAAFVSFWLAVFLFLYRNEIKAGAFRL